MFYYYSVPGPSEGLKTWVKEDNITRFYISFYQNSGRRVTFPTALSPCNTLRQRTEIHFNNVTFSLNFFLTNMTRHTGECCYVCCYLANASDLCMRAGAFHEKFYCFNCAIIFAAAACKDWYQSIYIQLWSFNPFFNIMESWKIDIMQKRIF